MAGTRRRLDRVADWLDVLPTMVAVAILWTALAGYVASRIGDGDHVAEAAVGAFLAAVIVSVMVARARIRRRR